MNTALKWKLLAGFVLVFLAGAAADGFFAASQLHHWRAGASHPNFSLAERMRNRIETKLDLTPAQIEQARPIFDRAAAELEKIRNETGQRVHQVITEANTALATELTPEQRARLKALEKKGREEHEFRKGPRRHGPPPPP